MYVNSICNYFYIQCVAEQSRIQGIFDVDAIRIISRYILLFYFCFVSYLIWKYKTCHFFCTRYDFIYENSMRITMEVYR